LLRKLVLAAAVLQASCAAVAPGAEPGGPKYRWDHKPGAELTLRADDKVIWSYHFKADGGFPYVHPLATADGTVLTGLAPPDHPWHRALWFAWKYLNGANYWDWAGQKQVGVPAGRTLPREKETVRLGPRQAAIVMELGYGTGGRVVLKETREITVGLPRDDGSYTMDWRMTFTAAEKDVLLERTPPKEKPWGGYAGLSFRGCPGMQRARALDSQRRQDKQGHGRRARWMDFSGPVGPAGAVAGVTIFDHPGNPRHPTPWYVSLGKMPYFSPALLFDRPYTLPAGKSFTLRYRVLVHRGAGDPAKLEKEYQALKGLK